MDTLHLSYNSSYNETFSIMDNPLIRFPGQTENIHRQMVFLKCFMISIMENKEAGQTLIQRLQTQITAGFVALVCIMLALSSELAWKALPLMLFCYSCQTLKFFAFESSLRRCISFIFNVLCCIEVAGFEFVFDVYFVLCFLGMGLYSLYLKKDHGGKDRVWIQRVSVLLVFFIEITLLRYSDIVDYKFTLFVNAALTLNEAVGVGWKIIHVTVMYNIMSQFILVNHLFGYDVDAHFDYFINFVWEYVIRYSGIV